ncbi:MAG: DNA cytosine methyltransferase [Rhodobacteraceae bacterium]|nr:DNA cytosine methyltransferase [Paracoccaceae bacterium]
MQFGSVCSGIEAASVAWESMNWQAAWFAEVEAFPSAVLAHRWPKVTNHGNMLKLPKMVARGEIKAPDILVGGTPCQAFSVAGKRGSLEDERGALTLAYVELLNEIDRRRKADGLDQAIAVWENVPGVLSTKDNAFGCFLAGLAGQDQPLLPAGPRWSNAGCVFGTARTVAWRILDAQYFGVAQRRRRVFVVASARKRCDPTTVLFEFDGLRRDTAPRGKTRQSATRNVGESTTQSGSERILTFDRQSSGEYGTQPVASTVSARDYKSAADLVLQARTIALRAQDEGANAKPGGEMATALNASTKRDDKPHVLTVHGTQDPITQVNCGFPVGRNDGQENAVLANLAVRRLTPRECERLQGFPDDHTLVPVRGKPAADGPRYKALGNSMAVPVMRWIGSRIHAHTVAICASLVS